MKTTLFAYLRNCMMATVLLTPSLRADDAIPGLPVGPELTKLSVEEIEKAYDGKTPPEAIRMYLAIVRGSRMGPGEGWFGPANQRYTWDWLSKRSGVAPQGGVRADTFSGSPAWFSRLDRDHDGQITGQDLDWSERNPWVQNSYLVNRLFRRLDPNGDGKLSREEWTAFFDKASHGQPEIAFDELRDAWLTGMSGGFLPGDAPTTDILLQGLFAGEVGSLQEGPPLDSVAPDFTLKTVDGQQTIQLSKLIGPKPIVLVFGNFTCGPFRSMYPEVEAVSRRFQDEATFVGVYVREAHPTDGWKMESNAKVGVAVSQPKTNEERTAVAQQCHRLLKPTIPLLVDTIDDSTGNAYSGMPARLYVIDTNGRVAYKSGRGPFGFKCGEMEQALVMTLLEGKGENAQAKTALPKP